ncbi:hypothetical protein EXIGLDRAFT_767115 [Exidia glandulosa HHB12029]|uniref:Uncharacterized protein n=1 Tax=Exidia glandulosa HHB12029 TaxID=1314781 RepID=A0A165J8A0_EXIGL|nr:hypothetical protein EXIGLDRAFT_767115 [Exidia glandulosa HHB12029]
MPSQMCQFEARPPAARHAHPFHVTAELSSVIRIVRKLRHRSHSPRALPQLPPRDSSATLSAALRLLNTLELAPGRQIALLPQGGMSRYNASQTTEIAVSIPRPRTFLPRHPHQHDAVPRRRKSFADHDTLRPDHLLHPLQVLESEYSVAYVSRVGATWEHNCVETRKRSGAGPTSWRRVSKNRLRAVPLRGLKLSDRARTTRYRLEEGGVCGTKSSDTQIASPNLAARLSVV